MMKMRVVEAGNHDAARKIDATRVSIGHCSDFVRSANRQYSIAGNRDRLRVSARRVASEDLAVQQDDVGTRGACCLVPRLTQTQVIFLSCHCWFSRLIGKRLFSIVAPR